MNHTKNKTQMTKDTIPCIFIRRRISIDDLNKLVCDVKGLSDIEGPETYVTSVYDLVRFFIFSNDNLAKEISRQSDTHESYIKIRDHILNYLRNILHEK